MDDVIPPSGGFIVIRIDMHGYMKNAETGAVIHRETRDLHQINSCISSFSTAKSRLSDSDELAILELTSEGGGAYVWLAKDREEEQRHRLRRFHSCYGGWPVRTLSI